MAFDDVVVVVVVVVVMVVVVDVRELVGVAAVVDDVEVGVGELVLLVVLVAV
jgi:hypothetical protein